jgi:hypothetical protein
MTEIIPNKPDVFDRLSPAQINSLALLAAGEPAKEVAAKVDVTPQTVSLWMNHDQDFRHALWLFKKQALDAARSELQLAATEAVTVVQKLLQEGSSEQIRLKAAQLLLDQLGLIGKYSANGFDGAAITPIGNYAPPPPPDRSIQVREAYRRAGEVLDSMRRRLGIVDPREVPRYGPPPVVGGDILDKLRLEYIHENSEASLKNGIPPTTLKVLSERHGVNYGTLRNHAAEDDWSGQLEVVIASQVGGAAT